jgi:hypothetical protein
LIVDFALVGLDRSMAITDQVERAILDAVRQVPADQLAAVLNYIRGLSTSGAADPEVYVGITPGGMSFEIPPGQIKQFLCLLVDTLEVDEVIISFKREDGSFAEYIYRPEALKTELDSIEVYLVDPSFLIEFEGGALYTGGGGCFSLRAPLTSAQVQRLIGGVLEPLKLDVYPHKEITGVALFDGRIECFSRECARITGG